MGFPYSVGLLWRSLMKALELTLSLMDILMDDLIEVYNGILMEVFL